MASTFSDGEKIARAKETVRYFHNRCVANWTQNYRLASVDALIDQIEAFAPGFSRLYGQAVGYATDLNETEISEAMERLADGVQGRPPGKASDLTAFYDALSDKLINWDFSKWGKVIAVSTVEAAGQVTKVALGGVALWGAAAVVALYLGARK